MLSLLLAASFTFTATATGVEKGTPVEFAFSERDFDRDYETMFFIDGSLESLCDRMEAAGMPRGKGTSVSNCDFWPVGCLVTLSPSLDEFIETEYPDEIPASEIVYTGARPATTNEPAAVFSFFSVPSAPFVFEIPYAQSAVYGVHRAKQTMKKGEKVTFTLSWDETTFPKPLSVTMRPGRLNAILDEMTKAHAERAKIQVRVDFDGALTVAEARLVAEALDLVETNTTMFNGTDATGHLYYRSFLPSDEWTNRQSRVSQPFELHFDEDGIARLLYIESDWTSEGLDPTLTEHEIAFDEAAKYPDIVTTFVFAASSTPLKRITDVLAKMPKGAVEVCYVFQTDKS